MYQNDLAKLSKEELIALALAQTAQIEELTRRVADLEAKLGGAPKTPDNSSLRRRRRRGASPTGPSAARRKSGRGVPACFGRLPPIRTGLLPVLQNAARTATTPSPWQIS